MGLGAREARAAADRVVISPWDSTPPSSGRRCASSGTRARRGRGEARALEGLRPPRAGVRRARRPRRDRGRRARARTARARGASARVPLELAATSRPAISRASSAARRSSRCRAGRPGARRGSPARRPRGARLRGRRGRERAGGLPEVLPPPRSPGRAAPCASHRRGDGGSGALPRRSRIEIRPRGVARGCSPWTAGFKPRTVLRARVSAWLRVMLAMRRSSRRCSANLPCCARFDGPR